MRNSSQLSPLVKKERRRLLKRVRRHGALKTGEHVSDLIRGGSYPIYYSIQLVEYLLRRREYEAAGRIIEAVDRSGAKNPLMDEWHSSWLWCIGKPRAALSFALKSARYWQKSFVVHHVGTLYRLMAERTGSDYYQKKSAQYWRLAHSLVKQEEEEEAHKRERNGGTH